MSADVVRALRAALPVGAVVDDVEALQGYRRDEARQVGATSLRCSGR